VFLHAVAACFAGGGVEEANAKTRLANFERLKSRCGVEAARGR